MEAVEEKVAQRQIKNLKQQRQAITPAQDQLHQSESDISNVSEDQEEVKVEVNVSLPEDKKQIIEGQNQPIVKARQEKDFILLQHYVDEQYLLLLIVLRRMNLINIQEISGLKEGCINLLYKHNKIVVRVIDNKSGEAAIENISNFIDKLNIQRTSIKYEAANKIVNFKKLKWQLSKDKIAIFGAKTKEQYELYIGGQMKPSQLRTHVYKINQIKVQTIFMRAFQNKRSYRIIIEQILNTQHMKKAFLSFNNVNFAQVQRKKDFRQLRLVLGSFAKKEITPPEYQHFIMKQLANFYVITFCLNSDDKYLQRMKCEDVSFIYLKQHKFKRSYVFVIALKDVFRKKKEEIAKELQKIGSKIMGLRFFIKIDPEINQFDFDRKNYRFYWFPSNKPYSVVLTNKQKDQKQLNWIRIYQEIFDQNSQKA